MTKKLFTISMILAFLALTVFATIAADNKAVKNNKPASLLANAKAQKLSKSDAFRPDRLNQGTAIWTDDFEGTQPNWVTDASWNHVGTATGGRAYQPETSWELTDANSHSPSHSWHAVVNLDQELDFVISPVIHLPTDVTSGGVTSPLKGLEVGYWFDVDLPEGTLGWWHLAGSAEVLWHFTHDDPGAGNSSWLLVPIDIQHWRHWITTPEIDLTGATGTVQLSFLNSYDSEVDFDYYGVDISMDNFVSYETLAWYVGDGSEHPWAAVTIDLPEAYKGHVVKIRFSSKGDYGTAQGFWALDDIKVSDGTTDFFFDDGGESGASTMMNYGFAPGAKFSGFTAGAQPNPNWQEIAPVEIADFGVGILPGDSIRLGFVWDSDGTATNGRGFFVDDVTLYGIGALPFDVAAVGAKGFQTAAVGELLAPQVVVMNVGLNAITATLRWQANITDEAGTVVHPGMIGFLNVTNFAPNDMISIPTFAGREWLVSAPGNYNLNVTVVYGNDGNPADNEITVPFTVWGLPFAEVVFKEDFFPRAGEAAIEDFGFTVVNGGGCTATGLNVNKWELDAGLIYGTGGCLLSWAWGVLDPGPDAVAPFDSSEVLDEALITPPIDISMLNQNGTLFMRYYVYFRPGHNSVGPPFGVQTSAFVIDFSIDGGATWYTAYEFVDDDGQHVDLGSRLPNHYYGPTQPIPTASYLGVDLTPALIMGGQTLHVRISVQSENSYFVGCSLEDMAIYSGLGHARIVGVNDIPEDQGKQVRVSWRAAFNDLRLFTAGLFGEFEEHLVTHYNLWRAVPGTEDFDFIVTVPAHNDPMYHYVAPTLKDGLETKFMVSAHTDDPTVFTNSKLVGGTSTDNLAPDAPALGAPNSTTTGWELTWTEPTNEEAQFYTLYRGTAQGGPYVEVGKFASLAGEDKYANLVKGATYFWVVTATDYAGNESDKSNEVSMLTGVSENQVGMPTEFDLAQNFPNPFNPVTSIKYALPVAGHVTLKVVNVSGQVVATLVDENKAAGYHTVTWDASNFSTGVYFYTMQMDNFKATHKMILTK